MTIEYQGNGSYKGTLHRANGSSVLYSADRMFIMQMLITMAFGKEKQPVFRVDEEAWTNDDWGRDFVQREENYKHQDDNKI